MFADVSDHMNVEDVRERYLDASYDLILAEGWRSEGYPKIVVVRDQIGEVLVSVDGLLAVVSNAYRDLGPAPRPRRCRRRRGIDHPPLSQTPTG